MANILELLSSLGVLETGTPHSVANSKEDNKTNTAIFSLASHAGPTSDLVGLVPGKEIQQPNRAGDPVPKYQPPLFWKALAFAFADSSYLSNATSLADEGQALFLANTDQAGVPAGKPYPDEVTNYQTFAKGDAIQIINHLTYSLEGDSYFESLALYIRSVVNDSDDPNLTQARAALIKAKLEKDLAYKNARNQYGLTYLKGSQDATRPTFIDSLTQDQAYQSAMKNELACENKYTTLQGDNMVDVSRKLDTIKNADDRLAEKVGNNMPCIVVSEDYIRDPTYQASGTIVVNTKDVYYRPLYDLPNFDATCNNWQALNSDAGKVERVGTLPILMVEAVSRSWSDLGHEGLDSAILAPLSDAQKDLLKSLQMSLTFLGKPAAVSLDRGIWDVPNVRNKFKSVASTLPSVVRRPFCKTTKMLFAWGIEISITFPMSVADLSSKNISLGFLKIPPLDAVKDNPNQMRFVAGRSTYPLLLAVLAKTV